MTIFNQELATMIANFDETIRPAFNAVVVNSGSYNITVGIRPENGQPGLQFDFKIKRNRDGQELKIKSIAATVNQVVEETRKLLVDLKHLIDDGELDNKQFTGGDVAVLMV